MTVKFESRISGDVSRSKFSRRADIAQVKAGAHSKP
jgi:hypothetical protein